MHRPPSTDRPAPRGLFKSKEAGPLPGGSASGISAGPHPRPSLWFSSLKSRERYKIPVPAESEVMSRVTGAALLGVEGVLVEVEIRVSAQLPRIDIVGLPALSVKESAARVRAAIASIGEKFPRNRITVNLAPAALRKNGAGLDLAIAVGIMLANDALEREGVHETAFIGELALDGRLRPIPGALAMALALQSHGCRRVVVPSACAGSASLAPDIEILGAENLSQVVEHLRGTQRLRATEAKVEQRHDSPGLCLSDVRGQESSKRALEIAAAGGHATLLLGPPGSGKTMLAQRLPGLLPQMTAEEQLGATRVHCAAGLLGEVGSAITERPFRAPHHSSSSAGLLGGGQPPSPGEVSLAHGGVLLLDELPEFDRRCRESLRQVLEEHQVTLARSGIVSRFPAEFMLVCTANPCPCGFYGSHLRDCRCDESTVERYRQRLSSPLLDRIDLHVTVPAQSWREWASTATGEPSQAVQLRVIQARQRQLERTGTCNARIPDSGLDRVLRLSSETENLLGQAVDQFRLSARATRRIQRVARTIADLSGASDIDPAAIAEAISYRRDFSLRD